VVQRGGNAEFGRQAARSPSLTRMHASHWALPLVVTLAAGCIAKQPAIAHTFPSTPRAVSELKRGWAEAVVGDYPVMAYMARESTGTLDVVREQFDPNPFGIAMIKGAAPLSAAVTHALRMTMSETTYMDILRNWGMHIGKITPPNEPASVPDVKDVPQLADGKLQVGMELAFAPMEFYDELKHEAGVDVELARALAKQLGVELELVNMGFDDLLPALAAGKVDLVISAMTITPERSQRADFVPYLMAGTGILVKHGNPTNIHRLRDLCGKTVALQEGTSQVPVIQSLNCE
jgi:ABC-type amino acid transport substrate-binding protein